MRNKSDDKEILNYIKNNFKSSVKETSKGLKIKKKDVSEIVRNVNSKFKKSDFYVKTSNKSISLKSKKKKNVFNWRKHL